MADLRYRFTLSHSSGSQQISEPEGWKDIKITLDRSPEYDSLIELFEVPLLFYGNNGTHDGGKDFILDVEQTYGINETIQILVEVSEDESDYDTLFNGLLNLETLKETDSHKLECGIIRNDIWSKFKNREDTPVNIQSETDLDGNEVDVIDPITGSLPGQVVNYYGEYRWKESTSYPDSGSVGISMDWDTVVKDDIKKFTIPRSRTSNISAGSGQTYSSSVPQFEALWDGDYRFQVKFSSAEFFESAEPPFYSSVDINARLLRAGSVFTSGIQFTTTNITVGSQSYTVNELDVTVTLRKGDQILITGQNSDDIIIFGEERLVYKTDCRLATTANVTLSGEQFIDGELTSADRVLVMHQGNATENGIYVSAAGAWTRATDNNTAAEMILAAVYITDGDINGTSAFKQINTVTTLGSDPIEWDFFIHSFERITPYPGVGAVENYCLVTAETTFEETEAEGVLLHDAAMQIIKRICNTDGYSEYLGALFTKTRQYDANGCESNHILIKGLHLRGYDFTEKNFFMSFKEWWTGANPIFNLGLSYETVDEEEVIRIEDKAYFYSTDISVNLSWVNNIVRSYDKDSIFKKISIGYDKWQSEDISGLDDPQAKKTYATVFETIGTEKTLYSKLISGSLTIEVTRRTGIELSTDYKFDNDVFIIAIDPDSVSSPSNTFVPERDENFTSTSDLLNPDTRYNLNLTPARNFLRWANYFNGALLKYLTSYYKFTSGEGNYRFASTYDCTTGLKKDCDSTFCDELAENQDIQVSDAVDTVGYLFTPELYEFEHPLSWSDYKTIRENRNKAIGVSTTDSNHETCFIKRLEYDINKSTAKITVWKR